VTIDRILLVLLPECVHSRFEIVTATDSSWVRRDGSLLAQFAGCSRAGGLRDRLSLMSLLLLLRLLLTVLLRVLLRLREDE